MRNRPAVHLAYAARQFAIIGACSYGLWQLLDASSGVVYHCHIRMDPGRYQLSEARKYYPYKNAKTVHAFLIAQPVSIPK